MPAFVAPEGFPAHQGFVSRTTPKLSRPLEAALILPARGFPRATALRFASAPGLGVIHPLLVALQIAQFGFHRLTLLVAQPFWPVLANRSGRRGRVRFAAAGPPTSVPGFHPPDAGRAPRPINAGWRGSSPIAAGLGQNGRPSDSKSTARHRPPPALWPPAAGLD